LSPAPNAAGQNLSQTPLLPQPFVLVFLCRAGLDPPVFSRRRNGDVKIENRK
jgi:hypothetical protein